MNRLRRTEEVETFDNCVMYLVSHAVVTIGGAVVNRRCVSSKTSASSRPYWNFIRALGETMVRDEYTVNYAHEGLVAACVECAVDEGVRH